MLIWFVVGAIVSSIIVFIHYVNSKKSAEKEALNIKLNETNALIQDETIKNIENNTNISKLNEKISIYTNDKNNLKNDVTSCLKLNSF